MSSTILALPSGKEENVGSVKIKDSKPGIMDQIGTKLSEWKKTAERKSDWNAIKRKAVRNIELAKAHERNKLPAGHEYYKNLYTDLHLSCVKYSQDYNVPIELIGTELPSLEVLKRLAGIEDKPGHSLAASAVVGFGIAIFGIMLIALWGAAGALHTAAYNFMLHVLR